MDLSQYGELFLSEAREHVSQVNHQLLALEENPGDREAVEGVFRSVHTIKGMAATLGFQSVTALAHELENVLDLVRSGGIASTPDLLDLLFSAIDALEGSIESAVDESRSDPEGIPALVARLREVGSVRTAPGGPESEPAPVDPVDPATPAPPVAEVDVDLSAGARVEVRISAASALPGVRAFMALQRARSLGEVHEVDPPEEEIQSASFGGRLHFLLKSEHAAEKVRETVLSVGEVEEVLFFSSDTLPLVSTLQQPVEPESFGTGRAAPGRVRSIRVDLERLDALTNQVGELVIMKDRLKRLAKRRDISAVSEAMEEASRLISEIQAEVMNARMVPVWQVLDRFPRLVRDAGKTLGKKVRLEMSGRETEFDRSMLDEIGDPLMHLIRNAVDHGIEPPDVRRQRGKSESGHVRIDVTREHSRVVVRVSDDGSGIDRTRVLSKAFERGMVTEEAADTLSDDEVYRFLTMPGFSTAQEVTDVSGRGVGLDVVATRVRSLGGTFSIQSELGQGSVFTIRLPLTLAVVRALMVSVDGQVYALPISHVRETDEIGRSNMRTVSGRELAIVRGDPLPLVRLRRLLGAEDDRRDEVASVVVIEAGEQRIGVLVDEMLGQREIVVKGFDATDQTPKLFSGATILPDGRPALILDAGSLTSGYMSEGAAANQPMPELNTW